MAERKGENQKLKMLYQFSPWALMWDDEMKSEIARLKEQYDV